MSLAAGTRLGPYEVVAPLGAGGMGEVYRARHAKLKRDVAVKVLPESFAGDPEALLRFEGEAQAVAALSHPNILAIHDFGTEGANAYAVMELLEGDTLRGRLNAGALSLSQAVDYALQMAKGIAAAHEKGIVHRDLKPENVFVTRDGHVKILDFGLSKRVDAPKENDLSSGPTVSRHTEPGLVMGTLGYMSPEQVRGQPVDHRSDIFSFGAILYELLTGTRAFKRATPSDTMAAILLQEPPEVSESGRHVPPALEHVVKHCLEKERDNRFQSAKDVAFALSEAVSTATLTSGARAVERAAPRKKPLVLAAAFAVLLVLAGVGVWRVRRGAAGSVVKRLAVLPFENQGEAENAYLADGIADDVRGKLTAISGLQVIARASSTPYRNTTKPPKQIAEELNAPYLLTATVRWEKSGGVSRVHVVPELVDVTHPDAPVARWRQTFDAALTDVFQVQSDIATKVAGALGHAIGADEGKQLAEKPTQSLAAYDAFLKGREAAGEGRSTDPPSLRKALGFFEQSVALDPGFMQAWAQLSTSATLLYANSIPTPDLAERARQAAEKAVALSPDKPDGYAARGGYERLVRNDLKRSAEEYEKGQRLAPSDGRFLFATALVEQGLGRWEKSLEHLHEAERLDPRSVPVKRVIGTTLLRMRRYREAREALNRALVLAPQNMDVLEYVAMTFLGEGDLPGARATLADAAKHVDETQLVAQVATFYGLGWLLDDRQGELLLRLTPSAFDDDKGHWAFCLADAYGRRGDAANMKKHAELAAQVFAEQVAAAPDDAGRHSELGRALALLGHKEEAMREGERAVALAPIAKDQLYAPWEQQQLALTYLRVGEADKAIDALEPLLAMPYFLSPRWLAIDPTFEALRANPRFRRMAAAPDVSR